MAPEIKALLERVMKLPPEARAALAGSILESLEDEVDEGIEEAWRVEIAKRVRDLDSGEVKAIPWARARTMMFGKARGRR